MSRSLSRAAALAAATPVLAGALVAVAPAASATHTTPPAPSCGAAVPVVDFDVSGSPTTVAVQPVSPTQTNICLRSIDLFDLVFVVNDNVTLGQPEVEPGGGQFECDIPLFEARQPVPFQISFFVGGSHGTLCVEVNGTATTLNVVSLPSVTAVPSFEVWTNGSRFLDRFVFCGQQYLDYVQDSSLAYEWMSCYQAKRRVL